MQTKVLIFDSRCSRFAGIQRTPKPSKYKSNHPVKHTLAHTLTHTHKNKMRIKRKAAVAYGGRRAQWAWAGQQGFCTPCSGPEKNKKITIKSFIKFALLCAAVARHVARTRQLEAGSRIKGRRGGKGDNGAWAKQTIEQKFFFGGPSSSCENSILPPYVAVKHIHHELGLPKAPYYFNSLLSPSFPLQVCTEAAIKHQHQQPKGPKTWLVLCAIYKSLDVSYFRLSNRHTHTCTRTHTDIQTPLYTAPMGRLST